MTLENDFRNSAPPMLRLHRHHRWKEEGERVGGGGCVRIGGKGKENEGGRVGGGGCVGIGRRGRKRERKQ